MNAGRIVRRMTRQLGWPGVLGLGLLVFAATFYVSGWRPAVAYRDDLQRTVEARQRELNRPPTAEGAILTPSTQLAEFHKAFPDVASQPDWLEKIFDVASREGIALEQGDYKLTRSVAGRTVRLNINLPVKCSYPQMRSFIARLKAEIPVLAVKNIQFVRQKVADPNLEIRLQMVLFMEHST